MRAQPGVSISLAWPPSTELKQLHSVLVVVHLLICLAVYFLGARKVFFRACLLPAEAYQSGSTVLGMLSHAPTLVLLSLGTLPLAVFRDRIAWAEIDESGKMRNFVIIVAAVLGVTFALSDYNYYYDTSFIFDRLAILALLIAIWFHPGFLFPFLVTMLVFGLQTQYPLPGGSWSWVDKRMPTQILLVLVGYLYVRIFVRTDHRLPLVLAITVAGAGYVHAGFSKLAIGPELTTWLFENPTSNIFVSAYQQGRWLGHLSEAQVVDAAGVLRRFDPLTNGYTLFAEIGGGLMLLDRRLTRFFLGAAVVLHLGILATTGIFFWKWIIVDLAMIWYARVLWKWRVPDPAVTKPIALALVACTFLLGVADMMKTGVLFAWWDTTSTRFLTYEVQTESGDRYELDPRYFAPYDITFVQSRFYYAVPQKLLPGTYGVTHRYPVFVALQTASVKDLPVIIERYGTRRFDPRLADGFRRFVQRYVEASMRDGTKSFPPSWLSLPYHFQTTFPANTYSGQSKIRSVHVFFEQHLFDGVEIHDVERTEVMTIALQEPAAAP